MVTLPKLRTQSGILNTAWYEEDVSRMHFGQLERYVRAAIMGRPDYGFLPPQFWHTYISMDGSDNPHSPQRAEDAFGQMYKSVPATLEGKITYADGRPIDTNPDMRFRPRLERVLSRILKECVKEGPSSDSMQLAQGALDIAAYVLRGDYETDEGRIVRLWNETGSWRNSSFSEYARRAQRPGIHKAHLALTIDEMRKDSQFSGLDYRNLPRGSEIESLKVIWRN